MRQSCMALGSRHVRRRSSSIASYTSSSVATTMPASPPRVCRGYGPPLRLTRTTTNPLDRSTWRLKCAGFSTAPFGSSASRSSLVDQPKLFYTPEQKEVMDACQELHSSIMPLNEKIQGPLAPQSDRGTALPFVLLVGNHSSGKSSFINYLLGRNIQTTGVAPTDDAFTVIAPGPTDRDQDGPALIGDPDMGFSQLRQFGPTLMHHCGLKIRADISSNFLVVDSPGMIDAPANYSGMLNPSGREMDRGYDFTGVVRWCADRADVVLLFFDPDKPGTTGETLSVLLHALSGMDHKLVIVLNKADQFQRIADFARAYGSLCWNLSKVIPRKDLPRIYTMCLPVADRRAGSPPPGLEDLHTARDEVVAEVRRAPERRMDNLLTRLYDSCSLLLLHGEIIQDLSKRFNRLWWQCRTQEAGVALSTGSLTAAAAYSELVPATWVGAMTATSMVVTAGLTWYHGLQLRDWHKQAMTSGELSAAFQRAKSREISEGDEYTAAVWQRVRGPLQQALQQQELLKASVSENELQRLRDVMNTEIPALRRKISPSIHHTE